MPTWGGHAPRCCCDDGCSTCAVGSFPELNWRYLLANEARLVFLQCLGCLHRWWHDTGFGVGEDQPRPNQLPDSPCQPRVKRPEHPEGTELVSRVVRVSGSTPAPQCHATDLDHPRSPSHAASPRDCGMPPRDPPWRTEDHRRNVTKASLSGGSHEMVAGQERTRRHSLCSSRRMLTWMPSTHK